MTRFDAVRECWVMFQFARPQCKALTALDVMYKESIKKSGIEKTEEEQSR